MPELTRLEIMLPPDHGEPDADLLLALLALHVPHGWEERSLPTGEMQCIVHSGHPGFVAELTHTLAEKLPGASVTATAVREQNWAEAWKEFFTPVEGGSHFLVLAPWMEEEKARTSRIPIFIEPKMAFGTGHHATTSLCLDALSDLVSHAVVRPGDRFLDLGTGSGILGIAAAKLGLTGLGLDIDRTAVDNALENRALNGLSEEQFALDVGSVDATRHKYSLIMANILAVPLKDMAGQIVDRLREPQGGAPSALVLSGMLDIQADGVADVYMELGLGTPRKFLRGEWAALVFKLL